MKWISPPRWEKDGWRRNFALFPVLANEHGTRYRIWLEWYQWRHDPIEIDRINRRPKQEAGITQDKKTL